MKKILALALAVAFITAMCAPITFGAVASNPDNTMTGNPDKAGGVNTGSGKTDMTDTDKTGGMNENIDGTSGNEPGTKLFGTFPKSTD